MYLRTLMTLVFAGICSLCTAQKNFGIDIDEKYQQCLSKDTSVSNIYFCAFEAYSKWDKVMDKSYKKLLKLQKANKDATAVKEAQTSWVAYRNSEFKTIDNIFDKPSRNWCLARANARIEIVRKRAELLSDFCKQFEKPVKSKE